MKEAQIIIKCPKCSQKALFKSAWKTELYVLRPELKGDVICSSCGYAGSREFSKEDYYYQIPIKNRTLYARTLENLIAIRDFFLENKKKEEPELDFPKEFYECKDEIIKRIDQILKDESVSGNNIT